MKQRFNKVLIQYCILTTCICAAMGISGFLFSPATQFGYEALFAPMIYAFFGVLSTAITPSTYKNIGQIILYQILQIIFIEICLVGIVFLLSRPEPYILVVLAICILIVYGVANAIFGYIGRCEAMQANKELKLFQEKFSSMK